MLNNLVWSFVKENKITVPVYRQLKRDKSVTSKIYGLPKLHKSGIPLRPIVSFIGAPTQCRSIPTSPPPQSKRKSPCSQVISL